ncbi:MAG: uL30 family ribosomal protein [Candidatus Aenigmarchaeota archaeon]|nr:uL30 family ribosomal protein [Candidatus Aenigmarchaeota archaeon]
MTELAVIRIRGSAGKPKKILDTLNMLGLKKPNMLRLFNSDDKVILGMVRKVKDFVTWGEVDEETKELLSKTNKKKKNIFNLHPPVKGFKSIKVSYPKGDLGYRGKNINKLIKRMI